MFRRLAGLFVDFWGHDGKCAGQRRGVEKDGYERAVWNWRHGIDPVIFSVQLRVLAWRALWRKFSGSASPLGGCGLGFRDLRFGRFGVGPMRILQDERDGLVVNLDRLLGLSRNRNVFMDEVGD